MYLGTNDNTTCSDDVTNPFYSNTKNLLDVVVPHPLRSTLRGGAYPDIYFFLAPGNSLASILSQHQSAFHFVSLYF